MYLYLNLYAPGESWFVANRAVIVYAGLAVGQRRKPTTEGKV